MTSVANWRCAPQGGVPGCAGRPRVEGGALSAAAGLAHPIRRQPFALRQFALGERLPLTGVQVIDPHSNLAMREAFAALAGARRR